MEINEKPIIEEINLITEPKRKYKKPVRKKRKKAIYHIDELKNIGIRRKFEEYARALSRKIAIYTYAVIGLTAFTFMLVTMCSVGYEGFINEKSIGVAQTKETIEAIKVDLNNEIVSLSGTEEGKIENITYKFKIVSEENYTKDEDIRKNMVEHSSAMLNGCSIYVDGTKMATLRTESEAKVALERIKNQYFLEGMECSSEILNKIELKSEATTYAAAVSIEDAMGLMNDVTVSTRGYTVEAGDSLWGIARRNETTVNNIISLNPDYDGVIHVGDILQVPAPKPVVDVKTIIRDAVIEESVENEMIRIDDPGLYIGQTKIVDYGQKGWRKVTADITRINGIEDVSLRVLKKEEMLSQPVPGKIHIGTTPAPRGIGSGTFIWPVKGYRITSRYGPRWGSVHTGLDMALATGSPVRSCDEGRVTFAGWNRGGYGNLIIVDHGNGYQTYYAHLSKIYVKKGEIVAQGETIGAVGNTGFSTGPHLHLEIRKNGVTQNPERYL
ncbi:MAG: M23 family metallopeptidase [Clostridia bacterium]|nr:M23 family metallopeptidase [Clostridia bacterium]